MAAAALLVGQHGRRDRALVDGRAGVDSTHALPAAATPTAALRADEACPHQRPVQGLAVAHRESLTAGEERRDVHGPPPVGPTSIIAMSTTLAPASAMTIAPVMIDDSSEARKRQIEAISSGSAGRRSGTFFVTSRYASSRVMPDMALMPSIASSPIAVRTQPGFTEFTRTPSGP